MILALLRLSSCRSGRFSMADRSPWSFSDRSSRWSATMSQPALGCEAVVDLDWSRSVCLCDQKYLTKNHC